MSSSAPILNPDTPLAFLPPDIASQWEISRYVHVATIGAFVWDILTHLPEEYRLLFKHRIALATVVYFLSRIATLVFIIVSTILEIGVVPNCQTIVDAHAWCFLVSVSATSFLFFLRVRAIFDRSPAIVLFFFLMWLAVLGGSMTVPFAIKAAHIGNSQYCIETTVKAYSSSGIVISAVNDAFVLFAISWRIVNSMAIETSFKGRLKSFLGLEALPAISKAVLQTGQQYYAITVIGNVFTIALLLSPAVPDVYRAVLTTSNAALMNSMACRVYRNLRFGFLQTLPTSTVSTGNNNGPPIFAKRFRSHSQPTADKSTLGGVEISKTVEISGTEGSHDHIPMNVVLPESKSYGIASE